MTLSAHAATVGVNPDILKTTPSVGTQAARILSAGQSGVDESTGAFTYTYPIALPAGRGSMTPNLTLSYNSQSNDDGWVGYGWQISIPYVERTNKTGVNNLYTDNVFLSSLGGELVYNASTTQYIQKVDDGSYQQYTFSNNVWEMRDRNGVIYRFGETPYSTITDGATTSPRVGRWYLTSVKDPSGNAMYYSYKQDGSDVVPYSIKYTDTPQIPAPIYIYFDTTPRFGQITSYRYGFPWVGSSTISAIRISVNGVQRGIVSLGYARGQNGYRPLLSTISESRVGTDGQTTVLPATQFGYATNGQFLAGSASSNSYIGYFDTAGNGKPSLVPVDSPVSNPQWTYIDINGDYVTDRYMYSSSQQYNGAWQNNKGIEWNINGTYSAQTPTSINLPQTYYMGQNQWWWNSNNVQVADINGDGFADFSGYALWNNGNFSLGAGVGNYDVNGDGIADNASCSNGSCSIYLGNGSGPVSASSSFSFTYPTASGDPGMRFVDINGDGLLDAVQRYKNASGVITTNVYINTGSSFVASHVYDASIPVLDDATTNTGNIVYSVAPSVKVDSLTSVTNSLHATTNVTYDHAYNVSDTSKLPLDIIVATGVKTSDGSGNVLSQESYTYQGGAVYYNPSAVRDRKFAGFQIVTKTVGNLNQKTYFYQGTADDPTTNKRGDNYYLIGKPYQTELYDGTQLKSRVSNTYSLYSWAGSMFVYPKETITQTFGTSTSDEFDTAIRYTYDPQVRLPIKIEELGQVIYNATTGVITDTGTDARTTTITYTASRPQREVTREVRDYGGTVVDRVTNFYDNLPLGTDRSGLLTKRQDMRTATSTTDTLYTYDSLGNTLTVTNANNATTTYVYDRLALYPTETIDALGHISRQVEDVMTGGITSRTDPNGTSSGSQYDGFGRIIMSMGPNQNGRQEIKSVYRYAENNGLTTEITSYNLGLPDGDTLSYTDPLGRVIQTKDKRDTTNFATQDFGYDQMGNVSWQSIVYDTPLSNQTTVDGTQQHIAYTYDALGRLNQTSIGSLTQSIVYGSHSSRSSDSTADVHGKTIISDAYGRLSEVDEENKGSVYTTKYTYDPLGNLISTIDAEGNIRGFSYDANGDQLSADDVHNPNKTTYGTYYYTYDPLNRLSSKITPKGDVITYTYDALDRIVQETAPDETVSYSYDTCPFGIGQVCSVSDTSGTMNYEYDPMLLISKETRVINGQSYVTQTQYDSRGRVVKTILPDGTDLISQYTPRGDQTKITYEMPQSATSTQTIDILQSATYRADGRPTQALFGNYVKQCYNYASVPDGRFSELGMSATYSTSLPFLSDVYAAAPQNTCATIQANSNTALYGERLAYDGVGNVVGDIENYSQQPNIKTVYGYDQLSRLTSIARTTNSGTLTTPIVLSPVGNTLSMGGTSYTYNMPGYQNSQAPTMINGIPRTYNKNGALQSYGSDTYTFDSRSRLTGVSNQQGTFSFVYDSAGERRIEQVNLYAQPIAQATTTSPITNIVANSFLSSTSTINFPSQATFNDLASIGITNKTQLQSAIDPLFTSSYIANACTGVPAVSYTLCVKGKTLELFYAITAKEKGVALSLGALEEIWMLYSGVLVYPKDATAYTNTVATTSITQTLTPQNTQIYWAQYGNGTPLQAYPTTEVFSLGQILSYMENAVMVPTFPSNGPTQSMGFVLTNATMTIPLAGGGASAWNMPIQVNTLNTFPTSGSNVPSLGIGPQIATSSFSSQSYGSGNFTFDLSKYVSAAQQNGFLLTSLATSSNSGMNYVNVYLQQISSTNYNPNISYLYKYSAVVHSRNATTTAVLSSSDRDALYSGYQSAIAGRIVNIIPLVSQAAYAELQNNGIDSNAIASIMQFGQNASTTKSRCAVSTSTTCIRDETLKIAYQYVLSKTGQALTPATLLEMWLVGQGSARLPSSIADYQSYQIYAIKNSVSFPDCVLSSQNATCSLDSTIGGFNTLTMATGTAIILSYTPQYDISGAGTNISLSYQDPNASTTNPIISLGQSPLVAPGYTQYPIVSPVYTTSQDAVSLAQGQHRQIIVRVASSTSFVPITLGGVRLLYASVSPTASSLDRNSMLSQVPFVTLYATTTLTATSSSAVLLDASSSVAAYYKLDGSSSDSKGTTNGTDSNVTYVTAKIGQGVNLNSASSNINFGNPSILQISGALTVGFWLKVSGALPTSRHIVFVSNGGYPSGYNGAWVFERNYSGKGLAFSVSNGYNSQPGAMIPDSLYADGNWHYIAGIFIPNQSTSIYMDGNLISSDSVHLVSSMPTSYSTSIGYNANNCPNCDAFTQGTIDEVGIFNRALTPSEISGLYNYGHGVQYPFTVSYSTSTIATSSIISNLYAMPDSQVVSVATSAPNVLLASTTNTTMVPYIATSSYAEFSQTGYSKIDITRIANAIAMTFSGYSACAFVPLINQNDCHRVQFVKYAYAIIQREKGINLSYATLSDLYDVYTGVSQLPNNVSDYTITWTKQYQPTISQTGLHGASRWGNAVIVPGSCGNASTYLPYNQQDANECILTFTLDPDILANALYVASSSIQVSLSGANTASGISQSPQISLYSAPILSPAVSGNYGTVFGRTIGTSSPSVIGGWNVPITLDITSSFAAWAQGIANQGIDILGLLPVDTLVVGNTISVTYAKPASVAQRISTSTSPIDPTIIAQVQAAYVGVNSTQGASTTMKTYISATAYNELQSAGILNQSDAENAWFNAIGDSKEERLGYIFLLASTTKNVALSRVTLEELYLVANGNGILYPESSNVYLPPASSTIVASSNASNQVSQRAYTPFATGGVSVIGNPGTCWAYNDATQVFNCLFPVIMPTIDPQYYAASTTLVLYNQYTPPTGVTFNVAGADINSARSYASSADVYSLPFTISTTSTTTVTGVPNAYAAYVDITQMVSDVLKGIVANNGIVIRAPQPLSYGTAQFIPGETLQTTVFLKPTFTFFDRTKVGTTTPLIIPTKPIITLKGSSTMNVAVGSTFTDPGATASDAQDGNITARILVSGAIDTSTTSTSTLIYSITDSSNQTASTSRTVIVSGIATSSAATSTPVTFSSATTTIQYAPLAYLLASSTTPLTYTRTYINPFYMTDSRGINTTTVYWNSTPIAEIRTEKGNTGHREISYFSTNHLGSPTVVTDANGNTTENITYDAYGNELSDTYNASTSIPDDFGYTSHQFDRYDNLTYAHARYLQTNTHEWISEDPLFWEVGQTQNGYAALANPQVLNTYAYANNNPIVNKDPDGRCGTPFAFFVCVLLWPDVASDPQFNQGGTIVDTPQTAQLQRTMLLGSMIVPGGAEAKEESVASNVTIKYTPQILGKAGELASGLEKNSKKILINGRYRIPDSLNISSDIPLVAEVKNVAAQGLTSQIQDSVKIAQNLDTTLRLYVRDTTTLSQPLQQAINNQTIVGLTLLRDNLQKILQTLTMSR